MRLRARALEAPFRGGPWGSSLGLCAVAAVACSLLAACVAAGSARGVPWARGAGRPSGARVAAALLALLGLLALRWPPAWPGKVGLSAVTPSPPHRCPWDWARSWGVGPLPNAAIRPIGFPRPYHDRPRLRVSPRHPDLASRKLWPSRCGHWGSSGEGAILFVYR